MCRTPVARVMTAATPGATYPQGSQASSCVNNAISCPTVPIYPIWAFYLIPMA